ncbi:putative polyketide synthase [Thozetella sp. PMI_491]|nr:putative polyketide synthase [Thozetella sp. PMI_491]
MEETQPVDLYGSDEVMPIAVVGMGFRGPGDANNLDGLWNMIAEKREAWGPVPKDRWNHEAFYHPDANRSGTASHYMQHDLSKFDAPFFSMTKAEADALDPQQRLLLECSYEALENAGIPLSSIAGSKTCCFVGSFCGDYTDMLARDADTIPFYQSTSSGHSRAIIANRLSYFFDLCGPSITIDTACSASLVALHLACQSLRAGETKQALVAGANVMLSHEPTISMTMMRFLSPDGRCYSFDERANGYSRGEGVGCVFLKPLADALRDGDPIRAVLRNTGSNQDGKTPGITLPSRDAQEELIRSVYEQANMDPAATSYVECHGTGTLAGDPLETSALANVFTSMRSAGDKLLIGSVKTNIGHLEGASGVAGLIKSVLMLERGKILPNRNFETPSKRIPFEDWKLKVPTEVQDFPSAGPRVISINSFGYGGTNAHAILQDAASCIDINGTQVDGNDTPNLNGGINDPGPVVPSQKVFVLSAFDEKAVRSYAESLLEYVREESDADEESLLQDVAYTLSDRRTRFPCVSAIHAASRQDLVSALSGGALRTARPKKNGAFGFIFTGQGAQWWGMGRELFPRFPVFAQSIDRASAKLCSLGASWDLREEMFKDAESTRVNEAQISQPVCTALQVALVDLLASWGLRPAAVTGHSSGEIAAAYCAGALTAEDAVAAAYHRGRMSELVKKRCPTPGAMMAIGMQEADALPLIANLQSGKAVIACVNSPQSLTISGDVTAVDELKALLDSQKIFARKLTVEVAYHSHHMSYVAEDYLSSISHIKPGKHAANTSCVFYSSVTGHKLSADRLGPQYWVDNMLGQVKFDSALREMCQTTIQSPIPNGAGATEQNITALCEVGPHSALAGPARQVLSASEELRGRGIYVLSCLVRNQNAEETSADALSKLIEMGFPANASAFNGSPTYSRKPRVLGDLPSYPWNHESSYWAESRVSKEYRLRPYCRSDVLGVPVVHFNPSEPRWRNIIKTDEMPWIKDHKVQGSVVYPAAGFLSMALEAVVQQSRERSVNVASYELREVSIGQALVVPEDTGEVEVILSMRPFSTSVRSPSDVWNEFTISSVSPDNRWTEHCRGLVRAVATSRPSEVSTAAQLGTDKAITANFVNKVDKSSTTVITPSQFYDRLAKLGLDYGPMFANVTAVRAGQNTAASTISIANTASVMPSTFELPFTLHPSTLDSLFHPLFAALGLGSSGLNDPYVPVLVNRLVLSAGMRTEHGTELDAWAEARASDDREVSASIIVFDKAGSSEHPVIQIEGLTCTKIAREEGAQDQQENLVYGYRLDWCPDVDEMSASDMSVLCQDLVPDSQEEERIEAFERAGFFLMKEAFEQLDEEDASNAQTHHKRLYNCIIARVAEHTAQYSDGDVKLDEMYRRVSNMDAEGDLLVHIGKNLVPIIQNRQDALALMIEEGRLDAYYRDNTRFDRNYKQAARYLDLVGRKNPNISILEIGSGTGGATLPILQTLTDGDTGVCHFGKFTFTDISTAFFEGAREKLTQWADLVTYAKLDIEADPTEQGFEAGAYDVILAANVLHATKSMKNTMTNVRKLLRPGGKLVLVELTRERFTTSTIFGTLPGWFASEEEDRVRGPTLSEDKWHTLLRDTGFGGLDVAVSDARSEEHHQGSMMVATACSEASPPEPEVVDETLIIHGDTAVEISAAETLSRYLKSSRARTSTSALSSCSPQGMACIVLNELSESSFHNPTEEQLSKIKDILTTAKAVLWITKGALVNTADPIANMANGFVRTVKSEYGNNTIVTLDLDPSATSITEVEQSMNAVQTLVSRHLLAPLGSSSAPEIEYAERGGKLLIPRLVPHDSFQRSMDSLLGHSEFEMVPFQHPTRKLVVEVGSPGLLDTIHFVDDTRLEPEMPADAVEISIRASGMNFKDVMMAMGQIAVETLGGECSGVINRIGAEVQGLEVGDRVACYAFGTYSNVIRQSAVAVQKIPDDMSFEVAATLPVTFCTAYYSVVHVARMQKGQSVLIHAATGGLGQALIEICRIYEAEIFCTVGTAEKKQLLMDHYGIPEDHILTSRDASFAPALMKMTGGRGVDVIMNSVAGDMLRVTWDCIAPFGVFVELGARDYTINSRLEMAKFARNVTFVAVNLVSLVRERPQVAGQVWADVISLFQNNKLKGPTPLTTYKVSQLEQALRLMQSGKHLGKLVLVQEEGDVVKAAPQILSEKLFKPDASYLLVGGMGGLGRAMALWMLAQGARHFIFASRSGLDRPEAGELKTNLEAAGAKVFVGKCDVSKAADLDKLMQDAGRFPPVKGVIQGAMVLRDALLSNMKLSDYEAVVRPKLDGTWNLHRQFKEDALDFFVMLSSTAGVVGNASQAAYAAASTFLDSFALYRRGQGLAASTIDLGVIEGIGYVAENQELARALKRQGFEGTDQERLMALLHCAVLESLPPANNDERVGGNDLARGHIVTGLGSWKEGSLPAFDRPVFSLFRRAGQMATAEDAGASQHTGADATRVRGPLKAARNRKEATQIVCDALVAKISSLGMIPIEDVNPARPLAEHGMDSLVAVEMRNWIAREMDATVPVLELMANRPMRTLAVKIMAKSRLVDAANLQA